MIPSLDIKSATTSDEDQTTNLLILAFSADPAARWAWPHPSQYVMHFPSFIKAFGGRAFSTGTAYFIGSYAGAALWLPPHHQPDENGVVTLLQRSVSKQILGEVFQVLEHMNRYHPHEPHWYLPLIGVDPLYQGRGFGSCLMQSVLVQCDRDKKMAYLESSNSRNIPFYERHGFEALGAIQVGSSPSIVPMLRRPR